MKILIYTILVFSSFINIFGVSPYPNPECPADSSKPWSYDNHQQNGVGNWGRNYPQCRGRYQSPINILTKRVRKNYSLQKLQLFNYDKPVTQSSITNNGYTVKFQPKDGVRRFIRVNGLIYYLNEIHFHWGDRKNTGSEHKVDYKQYSMEIHFVHSDRRGRLAVVGVFYKEAHEDNVALLPITDILSQISYEGDDLDVRDELYLDDIIDNGCPFFRYTGSLTTPGCNGNVIWTICRDVHTIGHKQIGEFRKLYSAKYGDQDLSNCQLSNNYRPTQPINGRVVFASA